MNSTCDNCLEPDDMLVCHPVNNEIMVCIACYQDALQELHNIIEDGVKE